jgi:hypothetical protein
MKSRSVILIVITLLIGFVIGVLTSAQLRYQKLKPVRVFFSADRFREGLYNTIQPDDAQKADIEEVLDKYAREMSDLQIGFRKDFDTKMKAFRKEIDSKLTKEQIARLREMEEKREEMFRQNRRERASDTLNRRFDGNYGNRRFRDGPPAHERHDSTMRDTINP